MNLKMIDVLSGIGGFSVGAIAHPEIEIIGHVEINGYKNFILESHFSCSNFGDINYFALPEREIPYSVDHLTAANNEELPPLITSCAAKRQPRNRNSDQYREDDVPSERYDIEFAALEDFISGQIDFPNLMSFSIPCTDVSRNNRNRHGMDGRESKLVVEAARICHDLNPNYALFECTEDFFQPNMGGGYIIQELEKAGYSHIEWHIISGAALGYPQYRRRAIVVAALPDTALAKSGQSAFTELERYAKKIQSSQWTWHVPSKDKVNRQYVNRYMVDHEPKSIQWRSLAINALGDGIIPKIPELIFKSIIDAEKTPQAALFSPVTNGRVTTMDIEQTLSRNGTLINGTYFARERNELLDIANGAKGLKGVLWPTLFKKEGNNNASGKSRAERDGTQGGFAGEFIRDYGITHGGLSKAFATRIMGYPKDWL